MLCYLCDSETAQSHGGRGIQDAVLTVPVGFTPEQRNDIRYLQALSFLVVNYLYFHLMMHSTHFYKYLYLCRTYCYNSYLKTFEQLMEIDPTLISQYTNLDILKELLSSNNQCILFLINDANYQFYMVCSICS